MTAPSLLHHVVYILNELVPWFILASVWILFHKDKFCHRAVVCFNVSKQPVDYIFLYKFTEPICWSFILLKVFIQFLNCLFKLFMFFIMFFSVVAVLLFAVGGTAVLRLLWQQHSPAAAIQAVVCAALLPLAVNLMGLLLPGNSLLLRTAGGMLPVLPFLLSVAQAAWPQGRRATVRRSAVWVLALLMVRGYALQINADALTMLAYKNQYVDGQLSDPAKVEEIYQTMLPVWEATAQDDRYYDRRKEGFEALSAFREGTFSLFGEKKAPIRVHGTMVTTPEEISAHSEIEDESLEEAEPSTQRDEVAGYLEDAGYVVSNEMLDTGISEYAAHGGKGNAQDIADYIEDELLSDEPESDLSDIAQDEPAEEEMPAALAPPKPKQERVVFTTLHPEIPAEQRHNFRIEDSRLGYGTPGEKFAANAAAIRCLKQIKYEDRLATPEEQTKFSCYKVYYKSC